MILGRLARGELGREGGRCVDVGELGWGGVFGIIPKYYVCCGSDARGIMA